MHDDDRYPIVVSRTSVINPTIATNNAARCVNLVASLSVTDVAPCSRAR